MFFTAKKDLTYSILIWGTISFLFILSIVSLLNFDVDTLATLISLVIMAIVKGFLILGWVRTGYEIEDKTLRIQGALFSQRINIQDIKRVNNEKSIIASAALSVDRLIIHYDKYKEIHIAPKNEARCIEELLIKNSDIQVDQKFK